MESVGYNNLKLTKDEKVVKKFLFRLTKRGDHVPCDESLSDFEATLPSWYDDEKYKRGQRFFSKNRAGIFAANIANVLGLLGQEQGLQILSSTGRSSTANTARRRYASTILHTLSWYECDLTPGSKSWHSLMQVRKMHLRASRSAERKKIGIVSQAGMALTQFGFMGLSVIRPHMFDINVDDEGDVEAFLHLWAVLGHMLGIIDEYNICLLSVNLFKGLSEAVLRYFMFPATQLETRQFKVMVNALFDGLKTLLPDMSTELQMFWTKRIVCVPGYQYHVDHKEQKLCRSILTEKDIKLFFKEYEKLPGYEYMEFMLFPKVPVYTFPKRKIEAGELPENVIIENRQKRPMDSEYAQKLRKYLGLDDDTNIILTLVDYEREWMEFLNDSKYLELSFTNRMNLALREKLKIFTSTWIGHYILDWAVSVIMWRLERFLKTKSE